MTNLDEYKQYRATTKNPLNYVAWMNHKTITRVNATAKVKEV